MTSDWRSAAIDPQRALATLPSSGHYGITVKDTCEQQLKPTVETTIGHLIAATDVRGIALAVVRSGPA
jgi:hypothetical protein